MEKFNFKDYVSNNVLLKENESPFTEDGWNEEYFENMGLMEVIANISKLAYEIQNARRGSYATDGTLEGIAMDLEEAADSLKSISNDLSRASDEGSEMFEEGKNDLKATIDAADNEFDENEYDSVDDYLETYTGGYKDEVEQHLKLKYEG